MMEQENMDDPLLEFMPDSKSTVLHYACSHKYYQVSVVCSYLVYAFITSC